MNVWTKSIVALGLQIETTTQSVDLSLSPSLPPSLSPSPKLKKPSMFGKGLMLEGRVQPNFLSCLVLHDLLWVHIEENG